MRWVLIVAHDEALVIGNKGGLPWKQPEDMRHFKQTTMGHPILMGRGVYEELGEKPLPGRENFVISSKKWENVKSFESIPEAMTYLSKYEKVFVIGGSKLYESIMPYIDEMIVTEVVGIHEGDVYFPEYRHGIGKVWKEVSRRAADGMSFVVYHRLHSSS